MSSPSHLDKIKKLRELTGVGFGDCNIAIKECGGDIEESIKYLRIRGFAKASKKMERIANDGLICVHEENNKLSIIEINCETDFAAKNLEFLNFSETQNPDASIVEGRYTEFKNIFRDFMLIKKSEVESELPKPTTEELAKSQYKKFLSVCRIFLNQSVIYKHGSVNGWDITVPLTSLTNEGL